MSYAYQFAEPAVPQLRQLDSWLAEETLDELELLASEAHIPPMRSSTGFVHDFVRMRAGKTYYVFLTILPDEAQRYLRVTSVGSFVKG